LRREIEIFGEGGDTPSYRVAGCRHHAKDLEEAMQF
jgi:hypothetical protein